MGNGEKVIGMLRHVIIGLQCRSRECTPSWTSDDEEEYTEVTLDDAEHLLTTMCFLPQHNHSPTMLHTCSMFQANHIAHAPVLEVMSCGHHKDLRGFTSASFGTIRNTSLLVICSFYYHILFTITPYMFMFCLYINTPVCCMYFASLNINLATYFSLTRSHLF